MERLIKNPIPNPQTALSNAQAELNPFFTNYYLNNPAWSNLNDPNIINIMADLNGQIMHTNNPGIALAGIANALVHLQQTGLLP